MSKLKIIMLIGFLSLMPLSQVEAQSSVFSTILVHPSQEQTYQSDSITVRAKITMKYYGGIESYSYSFHPVCYLDGKPIGQITASVQNGDMIDTMAIAYCEKVLEGLTQGEHTIQIKGTARYVVSIGPRAGQFSHLLSSNIVSFNINLGTPKISILSSNNYNTSQPTLNFTTNRADAVVSYSLNGQEQVTLPQSKAVPVQNGYRYDVTLTGLEDGSHTITVYATDNLGQTEKTFNINTGSIQTAAATEKPAQQPELPTTTLIVGAAIAAAIIAATSLLLIRKKHKH